MLTENDIGVFYLYFYNQIDKALKENHGPVNFDELYQKLLVKFNYFKFKKDTTETDKEEALDILNKVYLQFINNSKVSNKINVTFFKRIQDIQIIIHNYPYAANNDNYPSLLDWAILWNLTSHNCSANNSSRNNNQYKRDNALLIFLLILFSIAVSIFAIAYLIKNFKEQFQRLKFSEGKGQAIVSLVTANLAILAISGAICYFVGDLLLMALVSSSLLTATLAIVAPIAVMTISAALIVLFTNKLYSFIQSLCHRDALDPHDPFRYGLSISQKEHLEQNSFDVIKVLMAITEIRFRIEILQKKRASNYFSLFGCEENEKINAYLNIIRDLRKGNLVNKTLYISKCEDRPELYLDLKADKELKPCPIQDLSKSINEGSNLSNDTVLINKKSGYYAPKCA